MTGKPTRKPRYTNAQFEAAIKGSGGIIATIARRVGCDWNTVDTRIKGNDKLSRLFEDECSTIDDLAESVVIKAMQEGDLGAAKWWLERRRRGKYATRIEQELTGKDGGPVAFDHTHKLAEATDDDIERTLAALGQSALAASGRTPVHDDPGGAEGADTTGEEE